MEDKKHRILVIDDDAGILALIKHKLQKQEFEVEAARESEKAFDLLSKKSFDLIICDIMMPGTDGYEFRRRLLSDPSNRETPFVFLTAKSEPVDQVKGLQLKVDDYITKPFEPAVLVARINSIIERHALFAERTTTDQLTGVFNRQALEQKITKELDRIKRYGGKSSFAFIDIDDFKKVNDTYGHAQGDLVLIQLVKTFGERLRGTDFAGRYGGEEFLICMVNADKASACMVVERLLSSFRETPIGDNKIRCTFSAGIVCAPEDGMDFNTLCKKADEAMYLSKKNGKNQVTPCKD
jgi:diguanylate cyclase (GGDEF)-like protein